MIDADFDFRTRAPTGPLARRVERIWYARGHSPHGRERILPSSSAVLLFVLGPPMDMTPPLGDSTVEVGGAWLQGPHSRPILNRPTGETHALGVVFRPAGVGDFTLNRVSDLTNRIVPLDTATRLGPTRPLEEALTVADDAEAAMERLEAWVTRQWREDTSQPAWMDAAARLGSKEADSVSAVQEMMGVSRRHFVQQLRYRAGLTPKAIHRIGRMRRFLAELDARRPVRWAFEAVGAGFFDQAHAIREFKTFTGMTPGEYVRRRREAWGHDVEPGEAANFVPEVIR